MSGENKKQIISPERWRNDSNAPEAIGLLLKKMKEIEPPYGSEERVWERLEKGLKVNIGHSIYLVPAMVTVLMASIGFLVALYLIKSPVENPGNTDKAPAVAVNQAPNNLEKPRFEEPIVVTPITVVMESGGLYKDKSGKLSKIAEGEAIKIGDTIATNKGSAGAVGFGSSAVAYLKSATALHVVSAQDDGLVLSLDRGGAAFNVTPRHKPNTFSVVAGDVTISVVGTIFSAIYDSEGNLFVGVQRGKVEVTKKNGETAFVSAGESMTVPAVVTTTTGDKSKVFAKHGGQTLQQDIRSKQNEIFSSALSMQYEIKDLDGAILLWQQYLNDYEAGVWREDALFHLAYAYVQKQKFDEAKELLVSFLDEYPAALRSNEARFLLANIYRTRYSDCEEALRLYRKAIVNGLSAEVASQADQFVKECEDKLQ